MKDINSGGGTETDIEKRNASYNAYVENVTPNALRHSLLAAVYAL